MEWGEGRGAKGGRRERGRLSLVQPARAESSLKQFAHLSRLLVPTIRYLLNNLDWLEEELGSYEDEYLIIDCPGPFSSPPSSLPPTSLADPFSIPHFFALFYNRSNRTLHPHPSPSSSRLLPPTTMRHPRLRHLPPRISVHGGQSQVLRGSHECYELHGQLGVPSH